MSVFDWRLSLCNLFTVFHFFQSKKLDEASPSEECSFSSTKREMRNNFQKVRMTFVTRSFTCISVASYYLRFQAWPLPRLQAFHYSPLARCRSLIRKTRKLSVWDMWMKRRWWTKRNSPSMTIPRCAATASFIKPHRKLAPLLPARSLAVKQYPPRDGVAHGLRELGKDNNIYLSTGILPCTY
jgi:hypothetical protein